ELTRLAVVAAMEVAALTADPVFKLMLLPLTASVPVKLCWEPAPNDSVPLFACTVAEGVVTVPLPLTARLLVPAMDIEVGDVILPPLLMLGVVMLKVPSEVRVEPFPNTRTGVELAVELNTMFPADTEL